MIGQVESCSIHVICARADVGVSRFARERAATFLESEELSARQCARPCGGDDWLEDADVGWAAAMFAGGLGGWFASLFTKSNEGLFVNVVLGMLAAALISFLGLLGANLGGWLGYISGGFIAACLLVWCVRVLRSSPGRDVS